MKWLLLLAPLFLSVELFADNSVERFDTTQVVDDVSLYRSAAITIDTQVSVDSEVVSHAVFPAMYVGKESASLESGLSTKGVALSTLRSIRPVF